MAPPHYNSKSWDCHGYSGKCHFSKLYNTCRWPSLAWRQHLFSSLNTTQHHLVSQVTSRNNTIDVYICAFHLWCRNLTNCTGAYTPALSKWFWKVMFLPLGPHLLLVMLWMSCDLPFQCNDLAECLDKAAIQNLVYMCRNIHLNIVAKIKAQLTHHIQQTTALFQNDDQASWSSTIQLLSNSFN